MNKLKEALEKIIEHRKHIGYIDDTVIRIATKALADYEASEVGEHRGEESKPFDGYVMQKSLAYLDRPLEVTSNDNLFEITSNDTLFEIRSKIKREFEGQTIVELPKPIEEAADKIGGLNWLTRKLSEYGWKGFSEPEILATVTEFVRLKEIAGAKYAQDGKLGELEEWASETDGIDPNSHEWLLWASLLTKIQSLKNQ